MIGSVLIGDCRDGLRRIIDAGIRARCCVTSPPYWGLRDYGVEGQIGSEASLDEWVGRMVEVFRLVRDALADDGTLWLNLGDSYNAGTAVARQQSATGKHGYWQNQNISHRVNADGLKPKDLMGQPWRVAFALQADGWYLRQDIIWRKPNTMPESTKDRCTKAHEYIFLLSKEPRYYFDAEAIAEQRVSQGGPGVAGWASGDGPHDAVSHNRDKGDAKTFRGGQYTNGRKFDNSHATGRDSTGNVPAESVTRNRRSVWDVATKGFAEAHFATFPPALIEPCILAGSATGDVVLDPFMGAGTTALVAESLGRKWIGCELNPEYDAIRVNRVRQTGLAL